MGRLQKEIALTVLFTGTIPISVAKPYRPAELLGRVREALAAGTEAP